MATLTFSQLVDRSYKATLPLLKTYILGALLLIVVFMIFRGIGAGLIGITELPGVQDNLIFVLTAGIIGFVFTIASIVVQMLQNIYALVIAVDRTNNIKAGIRKALRYLWRLLLGGIWIMLRSFAWVSLIGVPFFIMGADGNQGMTLIGGIFFLAGVICAIYFLPTLAFTNIIQLKDGTRVRESANVSLKRTKGYWGKIVGNNLLMGLCIGLVTLAVVAIYAIVGFAFFVAVDSLSTAVSVIISIPLALVAGISAVLYFFAITLFSQMYMVELYETIKSNPKVVA